MAAQNIKSDSPATIVLTYQDAEYRFPHIDKFTEQSDGTLELHSGDKVWKVPPGYRFYELGPDEEDDDNDDT